MSFDGNSIKARRKKQEELEKLKMEEMQRKQQVMSMQLFIKWIFNDLEVKLRLKRESGYKTSLFIYWIVNESVPIRSTHLQEKELKKQRALLQKEQVCAVAAC